jgi:hypothetical protein
MYRIRTKLNDLEEISSGDERDFWNTDFCLNNDTADSLRRF